MRSALTPAYPTSFTSGSPRCQRPRLSRKIASTRSSFPAAAAESCAVSGVELVRYEQVGHARRPRK
ncbi:MAG TPA: hypothetical protein VGA12_10415 [Burkholderiales bacterium]|jgi:hypothetical protein